MNRIVAVILAGFLLVLGGCGDDSGEVTATDESSVTAGEESATPSEPSTSSEPSESPEAEPSAPSGPACEDVWAADGRIPSGYRGCVDGDTWVKARTSLCESGQVLVTYGDRYYGAKGNRVNDVGSPLKASEQYQQAVRSCG